MDSRLLGAFGEREAARLLRKKGYKILERNFEASQGEIDIIAKDNKELVFVEVKTRTDMSFRRSFRSSNIL